MSSPSGFINNHDSVEKEEEHDTSRHDEQMKMDESSSAEENVSFQQRDLLTSDGTTATRNGRTAQPEGEIYMPTVAARPLKHRASTQKVSGRGKAATDKPYNVEAMQSSRELEN
ncbi:unnamed protein product, partial [Amoebophrya sp. A25]|eukprot:GSA25T00004560001.1